MYFIVKFIVIIDELSERIKDSNPKMIIISSCGIEPKRVINYYNIVNKAIEFCGDDYKNNIKILIFQRYDSLYIKENEINRNNTIIYNEEIEKIKNKNIKIFYEGKKEKIKGYYDHREFKNKILQLNPLFGHMQTNDTKDLINFLLMT